mgnify:CR=1 FL=1
MKDLRSSQPTVTTGRATRAAPRPRSGSAKLLATPPAQRNGREMDARGGSGSRVSRKTSISIDIKKDSPSKVERVLQDTMNDLDNKDAGVADAALLKMRDAIEHLRHSPELILLVLQVILLRRAVTLDKSNLARHVGAAKNGRQKLSPECQEEVRRVGGLLGGVQGKRRLLRNCAWKVYPGFVYCMDLQSVIGRRYCHETATPSS